MAKVIENAKFEIVPAAPARSRTFGSAELCAAAGFSPVGATVDPKSGEVTLTTPDQPRTLVAYGRVNGRDEASTLLLRENVVTIVKEWSATQDDAKGAATVVMSRFPLSGEPPAPAREHAAQIGALRDSLLAFAASKSWTFASKSRKRAAIL